MTETQLDPIAEGFGKRATEALAAFPNTVGRCVNLCAYISARLRDDGILNEVCLGSLSCNGTKTFQYRKAFPRNPKGPVEWDGHAWLEFSDGRIGEPSLMRTARAQSEHSNLRRHLEMLEILDRGAVLMSKEDATRNGFKYTRKSILGRELERPLIEGLLAVNSADRQLGGE